MRQRSAGAVMDPVRGVKYVFEQGCKDMRRALDNGMLVIPHKLIEFEITQSLVIKREKFLKKFIRRIHSIGCTCSIDDFGSGYSSLNTLKEFNFDTIKLDRKFFYGKKGFDDESKRIVSTLISLSHDLGKNVVSEGIGKDDGKG